MMDDSKRWDLIHQKIHKDEEWHSLFAEEKEKLFPRNSLVVDLGAGTGADAIYFLKKGHSVIALDISEFALKVTLEKAKNTNLEKNLITRKVDFGLHSIPIKDDSVDVVYSRISINYFDKKQTVEIFKEIYRILKENGVAFISMKSPDDLNEMEYFEKSATKYEPNVFIEGGMLRSRFTKEQIEEILKEAGILGFEVRPYEEDLTGRKKGHHPILYVNVITFKKVKRQT